MIKYILYKVKQTFLNFKFNRKKEIKDNLIKSFGKIKDESFDFSAIENYFKKKEHSTAYQVLSDKTCADLDFDDLFMFIDRTNSRVGQQYLYNKLRTITIDKQQTQLNETLINKQY